MKDFDPNRKLTYKEVQKRIRIECEELIYNPEPKLSERPVEIGEYFIEDLLVYLYQELKGHVNQDAARSGFTVLVRVLLEGPKIPRELDHQERQVRPPVALSVHVLGPPDPHLAARGVLVPTSASRGCVGQCDPATQD